MFAPGDYRKRALDYGAQAKTADNPDARTRLHALEQSFRQLADNEQWLADNHDRTIRSEHEPVSSRESTGETGSGLAKDEEYILRCLGAAVILQWNTIPTKLQRELFDAAGSMGELIETGELRSRVARFLHKHKDDTARGREGSGA
jgi:hypothetical protein